jgi:hypothetical protein
MMMKKCLVLTVLAAAALAGQVRAGMADVSFSGPGVSGNLQLTFGTATDAKYPQALEVTGISGTFTDTNNGLNIVNATVGSLVAVTRDAPESTNHLAPNDFSRFPVTAGLPPQSHGSLSFDNLYWPTGSPPTATDYQVHGGFLDIYGLLFTLGTGQTVNLWSNGDFTGTGTGAIDYGVAVVTSAQALDYVPGGVAAVPEPGAFVLLGIGVVGMLALRRTRPA